MVPFVKETSTKQQQNSTTNGFRAVSDRVSGASTSGKWPTPGNVVPAYWLVASTSYDAPSDRKVAINSRWVRFTYKNSVDDGGCYVLCINTV